MKTDEALSEITRRMIELSDIVRIRDSSVPDQRSYSKAIGVNPVAFSQWKSGKQNCTLQHVYNAVVRFKLNPLYVLTGAGSVFMTAPQLNELGVSDQLRELQARVEKLEWVLRSSGATRKKKA